MVKLPGSFDCKTKSSAFPSKAKLSVRNVFAGFESFPRNQAEQAFSVCRISRTLSRARRIFWPGFPIAARSSCTRSLGALQPTCARLAGLHGFTGGALAGGVSQDGFMSPDAGVDASGAERALPDSLVHGALPRGRLASSGGSAARRMKLTPCGDATLPERHDRMGRATARMLRGAEYISFSPPDLQLTTDRPRRRAS